MKIGTRVQVIDSGKREGNSADDHYMGLIGKRGTVVSSSGYVRSSRNEIYVRLDGRQEYQKLPFDRDELTVIGIQSNHLAQEETMSTYRNVTIERIPHNGMYAAAILLPGGPFGSYYYRIAADTLSGIKSAIRQTLDDAGNPRQY